tara:strand:- start:1147 stop:2544 length:1398 start_codon:yes stop_codon:yes gene_type:complete
MAYEGALSSKAKASYPKPGNITEDNKYRQRYSTLGPEGELSATNQPNLAKIRVVSQIAERADPLPTPYVGFFLVSVQEDRSEKAEIVPLPGDDYAAFFYGEMPRNIAFTGVLLNTQEDLWRDAFETLYEDHLRGTVNSARGSLVQIKYGERIVSGWLMNFSQSVRADSDLYTQFNFTVLVKSVHLLNIPGSGEDRLYKRYVADTDDDFPDPARLSVADLDATLDRVQTGYVAPPPKPRRGRGRRRSNCVINPALLSGGEANANNLIEDTDAFFSSGRCRTTDVIQAYEDRANDFLNRAERAADRGDRENTEALLNQAAAVRGVLQTSSERVQELVLAEAQVDILTIQELPEVAALQSGSEDTVAVQYGSSPLNIRRDGEGRLVIVDSVAGGGEVITSLVSELGAGEVLAQRAAATRTKFEQALNAANDQARRSNQIRTRLAEKRAQMERRARASSSDARLASAAN